MVYFLLERKENIVGKGENAGYQHFPLFPHCFHFLPFFFLMGVKSRDFPVKGLQSYRNKPMQKGMSIPSVTRINL